MSLPTSKAKDYIQIHDTLYRIISKMTHGGMGEISLVQNTTTGQFFALKHFFPHAFSCQEDCEEYWRREQEIMRIQSQSPVHAIQLIDAFTLPSSTGEIEYYLLMEYVQGITLEDWINQHPGMPNQEEIRYRISQIIIPLCQHLEFIHSQGIIHRDITPRNVMLIVRQERLTPILIDWGVAKHHTVAYISRPNSSTNATMIASIGNPPEVLAGLEPVIPSDVYMVGYLLNYLLTGGQTPRPYREADYILDPKKVNPNVGTDLSSIISQMTQFESKNRIQSFTQVLDFFYTAYSMNNIDRTETVFKIPLEKNLDIKKNQYPQIYTEVQSTFPPIDQFETIKPVTQSQLASSEYKLQYLTPPQVQIVYRPKPKIIESLELELAQINTTLAGSIIENNSSHQRKLLREKKEILEKLHTYFNYWRDHQRTDQIKAELDAINRG